MGHAGAFTIPGEPDARAKIQALQDAGVTMVSHPAKFGDAIKKRLEARSSVLGPSTSTQSRLSTQPQRRHLHTLLHRPQSHRQLTSTVSQKRTVYLSETASLNLLRQQGIIANPSSNMTGPRRYLAVGIDRSSRSPCIIASPESKGHEAKRFPISYPDVERDLATTLGSIASHLRLTLSTTTISSLQSAILALTTAFRHHEAFFLSTEILELPSGCISVVGASIGLDDAAFRSLGRQPELHTAATAGPLSDEQAEALEASKHGIVYIRLPGDSNTIGTLVNGAGLAMNTVDALSSLGGRAANFLDTGGKATSETVKKSFEIILRDPRVNVVFVNIFGGLTLGDMIARGVLLAFKELGVKVPVVVRIRGTNEQEGQRIIAESGLPLFAFDGFEEAAAKVIELSRL